MSMNYPPVPGPAPVAKKAWYKRHWVHMVGVSFLFFAIGAGTAATDTSTSNAATNPASSTSTNTDAQKALDERKAELDKREADLQKAEEEAQEKVDEAQEKAEEAEEAAAEAEEKADAAAEKQEKQAAANSIDEGTYEVGVDIKPGTYRTAGPADDSFVDMCYWARLSNLSGDMDSIITNDNISGPTTITIKATDKAFETNGCQLWVKR